MGLVTIGIDLGGSNVRVGVVLQPGVASDVIRQPLTDRSVEAVVSVVGDAVEQVLAKSGHAGPLPVGVGVAGQVEGNRVSVAPNLGWRDVALGDLLAERLKTTVTLSNDLSAAAWGEFKNGAGRGEREVLTVFVGTGVGSAIITGGQLLKGASGVAGELGHVKIISDGRLCGCGERGCLEAYVGGAGLAKWMSEKGFAGGAAELANLATAGDAQAKDFYGFVVTSLGMAIANMVTVLNPARLVLGGGVLSHSPALARAVIESVKQHASARSVARLSSSMAGLGDDSGLIGAALLCE